MPSVETLVTFALAGVVFVVVPGPSVLFIVGRPWPTAAARP